MVKDRNEIFSEREKKARSYNSDFIIAQSCIHFSCIINHTLYISLMLTQIPQMEIFKSKNLAGFMVGLYVSPVKVVRISDKKTSPR